MTTRSEWPARSPCLVRGFLSRQREAFLPGRTWRFQRMASADPAYAVFDESHYAATLWRKLYRALQLGPKYYFWDLPRYFASRKRRRLRLWDGGALLNPLKEFRARSAAPGE